MRAMLSLATVLAALFFLSPTPVFAQLGQITACHEVSTAVLNVSRRRAGTGEDCNRQAAIREGLSESRVNARNALDNSCIGGISAARANAICAAAGKSVPTSTSTSLQDPPVRRAGSSAVDSQLPIPGQTRVCVVLRDLPNETETRTRDNGWCWFDNFRETVATVRSRARCGVQCR